MSSINKISLLLNEIVSVFISMLILIFAIPLAFVVIQITIYSFEKKSFRDGYLKFYSKYIFKAEFIRELNTIANRTNVSAINLNIPAMRIKAKCRTKIKIDSSSIEIRFSPMDIYTYNLINDNRKGLCHFVAMRFSDYNLSAIEESQSGYIISGFK